MNGMIYNNRFIIIDSLGNIIKDTEFGSNYGYYTGIKKVRKVADGFIIGAQMIGEGDDNGNGEVTIIKLDFRGEILWQEHFPLAFTNNGEYWLHQLTGLDIMPSGSILATGYGESNENEYCSFLIKLDKNGCVEPGCRSVTVKDEVIDEISIYPNPNSGSFVVECLGEATISIYDISGVKIMQKSLGKGKNDITLSDKHNGVFIAKIACNSNISVHKIVVE